MECTQSHCSWFKCTMKCIYRKYSAQAYELNDAVVRPVHYVCEEERIISGHYNGKIVLITDRQQGHKQNIPNRFQPNGGCNDKTCSSEKWCAGLSFNTRKKKRSKVITIRADRAAFGILMYIWESLIERSRYNSFNNYDKI